CAFYYYVSSYWYFDVW
nr:immunoglobulin heavy chain junction region [Mus musculus]MBK4186630.1 immunoglobulin heavy chain junction region [Mus musculus]MBK4186631.1 immunoglobulin heavy chain junction region [Mus musculus]MBK4186632.1 immunoglobulin heavy chain junction region [Mus musculus]MBK4186635.1 immunoglobulin heavy chain junction region [Mus musculus]